MGRKISTSSSYQPITRTKTVPFALLHQEANFHTNWVGKRCIPQGKLQKTDFYHRSFLCRCRCHVPTCVQLFGTLWNVVLQASLSMEISRAKILEQSTISSSRGSSQPRDQTEFPVSPALQADSLPDEVLQAAVFLVSSLWQLAYTLYRCNYFVSTHICLRMLVFSHLKQ